MPKPKLEFRPRDLESHPASEIPTAVRQICPSLARLALVLCAGLLVLAGSVQTAHAISISISEVSSTRALDQLVAGDEITLGIVLSNPDNSELFGIGVSAFGFDPNVIEATSVISAGSIFDQSFLLANGDRFAAGGLASAQFLTEGASSGASNRPLVRSNPMAVPVVQAISLGGATGSGFDDVGVNGQLISEGGVHARVSFTVLGGGATSIQIGSFIENGDAIVRGGGAFEETDGDSLDLTALGDRFEPPVEPMEENANTPTGDNANDANNANNANSENPVVDVPITIIRDLSDGDLRLTVADTFGGSVSGRAVPEPTSALLYAAGLAVLASRRAAGNPNP